MKHRLNNYECIFEKCPFKEYIQTWNMFWFIFDHHSCCLSNSVFITTTKQQEQSGQYSVLKAALYFFFSVSLLSNLFIIMRKSSSSTVPGRRAVHSAMASSSWWYSYESGLDFVWENNALDIAGLSSFLAGCFFCIWNLNSKKLQGCLEQM